MKLTLHILGKDLRRQRGRLAWWVAVLVAKTALGFALLAGDAPGYLAQHAGEASILLVGLDIGLCFLLAALLVQEDLLVGTRAFWLTRPVSGARLLAAKLLGAGLLFGALPVLIWMPWWLHCGYGVRELAWAGAETLFWQMLVVVPATLLATLTDSIGRVLLWLLALLAGVQAGLVLTVQWFSGAPTGVGASQVTVMTAALIVTALATVVRQYLSRQRWRSLGWFGAGCAASFAVAALWPWNIYASLEQRDMREENAAQAAGAFLEFEDAIALPQDRHEVEDGRQRVDVHLRMRGLSADLASAGDTVRQTWHWAGGPDLSIEGWGWGTTDIMSRVLGISKREPDAETQRYLDDKRKARGGLLPRHAPPAEDGLLFTVSGQGPRSMVARLVREPAAYRATGRFLLLRPEVWFDKALVPGSWQSHSATGVRITRVEQRGPAARVSVVQTLRSLGNQALYALGTRRAWQLAMGEPMMRVINRAHGDSLFFAWDAACPPMRVGSVVVRWMTGEVKAPKVIRSGKWVPRDRDWFAGARFAVVGASEVGSIVREVKVEEFTLSPVAEKKLPAPKR